MLLLCVFLGCKPSGSSASQVNWIVGTWSLTEELTCDVPVWIKKDSFERTLKLYAYQSDNSGRDWRWIIGTETGSDAGFAYSTSKEKDPTSIGDGFLRYDEQAGWIQFSGFRFTPSHDIPPQVTKTVPRNGKSMVDNLIPLSIEFTHLVEAGSGNLT